MVPRLMSKMQFEIPALGILPGLSLQNDVQVRKVKIEREIPARDRSSVKVREGLIVNAYSYILL